MKYRVGIVGFGWVAGAHLESFCRLDSYEPAAIMSRRDLDPKQIKESHGVDVKIYNDWEKFLQDDGIDVVDICTPHFLHPRQTIDASNAGKQIVIEKPIALSFADAKKMLDVVEKNGTKTSVCFEVRFISSVRATKSMIDQGLIGDIYYGESDYYHGIGPWYANQQWEVEEVFTYGNKNPNEIYKPYDYDLNTVTDCRQPYVYNVNIVGSEGSIVNDRFHSKKIEGLNGWCNLDVDLIDSGDVSKHPYDEQFDHFAECLDHGKDPHNNLRSAFESHRVIFAADTSNETGKPVRLDEFTV
jgi:UDP-N-acetyl-2-amino-2-deoxyglucuronate dehydrogenase